MPGQRRILLVDDEANFRWSLERALIQKGFQVKSADSAESAREILNREDFELVITDVRMPGMDGFEFVQWLMRHKPSTRVLITTAYGSPGLAARSDEAGALSYMEKPVDLAELTDYLGRLFGLEGFAGKVRDFDLTDYVQIVHSSRRNKRLEVQSIKGRGKLYFEQGQLVHAQVGEITGRNAFFEILSWPGGHFSELPWRPPPASTIEDSMSWLLMEAVRRRDEGGKSTPHPPPPAPTPLHTPRAPANAQPRPEAPRRGDLRAALAGLETIPGLSGALLVTTEGLVLARAGQLPDGIEGVWGPLSRAITELGHGLGAGEYEETVLHLAGGGLFHVERVEGSLLGLHVAPTAEMAAVRRWVREVAGRLQRAAR